MRNITANIILVLTLLATLAIVAGIGQTIYQFRHAPRVEVSNGQKPFHRVYGYKLDSQTFAVPCQIGDFFRIAADNKTIITSFAPIKNGWAIIHFEYVN